MNIKRIATTAVVFLACVVVSSTTAGGAAAEPELPPCQSNPFRSEVVHEYKDGSWGYLYRLIWCVEGAQITWAVADVVPVLPDTSNCTWQGPLEDSLRPAPNGDDWIGFNMGSFTCPTSGGMDADFPWGILHIRPDGTSAIQDQDTA